MARGGLAPVLAGGPEVVGRNIGVMKGTGERGRTYNKSPFRGYVSLSLCDEITLSSIAEVNDHGIWTRRRWRGRGLSRAHRN